MTPHLRIRACALPYHLHEHSYASVSVQTEQFSHAYEHSHVRTCDANEPFVPFDSGRKNRFKSERHKWRGE